jgi:hypothetical protein
MARRRRWFSKLLLLVLVLSGAFAAFWFGMVPQRLSPLAPISLAEPDHWFLDFRLKALKQEPAVCAATLKRPHIAATAIEDRPVADRCGWRNAVRISEVAGAELAAAELTCETAAALALWAEHDLQPLAQRLLGARVVRIDSMGTYACRNIVGNRALTAFRSQHASANAIDVSGFRLSDGRAIRLLADWQRKDAIGEFLREAHRRACRYFRVALSPDFNAAHRDHFHFDRGFMWTCR